MKSKSTKTNQSLKKTVLVEKSIPEFAPGETVNKKGKEIVDGKKGKEVDENLTLEEAIQKAQKIEKKVAGNPRPQ